MLPLSKVYPAEFSGLTLPGHSQGAAVKIGNPVTAHVLHLRRSPDVLLTPSDENAAHNLLITALLPSPYEDQDSGLADRVPPLRLNAHRGPPRRCSDPTAAGVLRQGRRRRRSVAA